jgi:thymidylate kinase
MVTVFEGPDRVGKSTQILNLKRHLEHTRSMPSHIMHYSNLKIVEEDIIHASKCYYKEMFEFTQLADKLYASLILDRSHIGESVYSPLYRNYDGDYVFDMEQRYNTEYFLLFVFIADPEVLIKREDGISFSTDLEIKKKEIELFKLAFNKSHIKNKYLIDVTNKDVNTVWQEIEEKLRW